MRWHTQRNKPAALCIALAAMAGAMLGACDTSMSRAPVPGDGLDGTGIKGAIMRSVQRKAGAGVPSADRITLLRDADGDGRAEIVHEFATGLNSPFGMALVGSTFYVADTDAVLAFDYQPGQTSLSGAGRKLTDLPAGPRNHHWTRNILASPDGRHLYVTVGSNSNVAALGLAAGATALPTPYISGMFVGQHGSWNGTLLVAYDVGNTIWRVTAAP